jgi:hypothetical protein
MTTKIRVNIFDHGEKKTCCECKETNNLSTWDFKKFYCPRHRSDIKKKEIKLKINSEELDKLLYEYYKLGVL